MEGKLYRSHRERMISGVCGGIAEYFGADPTLVRLIAVLLTLVSFGSAVVAYIVMSIVVPEEPLSGSAEGGPSVPYTTDGSAGGPEAGHAPPQGATATTPPPPPPYTPTPLRAPEPERPRGRGGIAVGLVLVFIGLALLATQFIPGLDLWRLWPLIIVIVGIRVMLRGSDD